jgi:hypothetical protein
VTRKVWHPGFKSGAVDSAAQGEERAPVSLAARPARPSMREGRDQTIAEARILLADEVRRYNERQVHSTTLEIPIQRFERAVRDGPSQIKPFVLPSPFTSPKDIFCLVEERIVDGYHHVSWRKQEMLVPRAIPVGARVELHIIPDPARPEVRIWYAGSVRQVVLLQKP